MTFDILAIEEMLAYLLDEHVNKVNIPVDVATWRYPQLPERGQGHGESGRPASIYVGYDSFDSEEVNDADAPIREGLASVQRKYAIAYNLALEVYDHVNPDDALRLIMAIHSLNGYLLDIPGSRPLQLHLDFESHEEGYWTYQGNISFTAIQHTAIATTPGLRDQHVVNGVRASVWVKTGPPGATPLRQSEYAKDAELIRR